MSSAESPEKRIVLAAGTSRYADTDFPELDQVPAALQTLVAAVRARDFLPPAGDAFLLDPETPRLADAVQEAARAGSILLIYYTGHGVKSENGSYYLVTTEATTRTLSRRGFRAALMAEILADQDPERLVEHPQVLLILDCCFSGEAGLEMLANGLRGAGPPNAWLIASASPVQWARQGAFAAAFSAALEHSHAGRSQRFVGLEALVGAINERAGSSRQTALCFPPVAGFSGVPPFFANPGFAAGVNGLTLADQRMATDPTRSDRAAHCFEAGTGRSRALIDVCRFVGDPAGGGRLAVVTGAPGSGKSALLAMPGLLAGALRDASVPEALRVARDTLGSAEVVSAGARQLNTDQTAQRISALLGLDADTAAALLEALQTGNGRPLPVVAVDALDEARYPRLLLRSLLRPLARDCGVRLLIGTRRTTAEVADLVADAEPDLLVDLDDPRYRDPDALRRFVRQLLSTGVVPVDAATDLPVAPVPAGADLDSLMTAIVAQATTGGTDSFFVAEQLALAVRSRTPDSGGSTPVVGVPADWAAAFREQRARLDA